MTTAPAEVAGAGPPRPRDNRLDRRTLLIALGVAALVFVLGLAVPSLISDPFYQGIAVSGAILGIMALGIGFLAHRLGLISAGQTAFYGASAYLVAIATTKWGWSPDIAAIAGFAGGTILAAAVGAMVVRSSGMVFVMLTLAFGQLLYQIVILDKARPTTGGFDGTSVTFDGTFFGMDQAQLGTPTEVWPLVWGCVVLVAMGFWLIGRSRLGTLLEGIRENEERARFSGYDTYRPRLIAFTLAGAAASLAGVLFALNSAFITPEAVNFSTAANSLIAAIVGGLTTLAGPVVGAILYVYAQAKFASGNLALYTGIALVLVLAFLPGGIAGAVDRLFRSAYARLRKGKR